MSFIIIAIHGQKRGPFTSEYPVLSLGSGVDDGYIHEVITYYHPRLQKNNGKYEYPGKPSESTKFTIGACLFVKIDGAWYYQFDSDYDEGLHLIVYGNDTLEKYGSGQIFERSQQAVGVD